MFNDKGFFDKFDLSNLDLKDLSRWVFKVRGGAAVKPEEFWRKQWKGCDNLAMSMSQLFSLFLEGVPVVLKEMG